MNKPATKIIIGLLFSFATLHLLRILLHVDIQVEETLIPRWVSLFAFATSISLGVLLAHESD